MSEATKRAPDGNEIADLMQPLRRYALSRTRDRHEADDVVQETLLRVLTLREPLAEGAELAFALVVARNLIASRARDAERARRHAPQLLDRSCPERPDDMVLAAEESQAVREALAELPASRREPLLAHVVEDKPITSLADDTGSSPGAVAAHMSRTRAQMRLNFVLAMRHAEPPTPRCRPVLLSLSAGDIRRQNALRAGRHLINCDFCSDVSVPLLSRRSSLAAIAPWFSLGAALEHVRQFPRTHPIQSATLGVGASAICVAAAVAITDEPPVPQAPATSTASPSPAPGPGPGPGQLLDTRDGSSLLPPPPRLTERDGHRVVARAVRVLAVPADEGFWIGDPSLGRMWVQLTVESGGESQSQIRPDDRVSFAGEITTQAQDFAARHGLTEAEGADRLRQQGVHLAVDTAALKVTRSP